MLVFNINGTVLYVNFLLKVKIYDKGKTRDF